ncbi:universal stress protein [Arthrobacter alpinus]|nr:universal stress protein [Arthrobacter alpinus]
MSANQEMGKIVVGVDGSSGSIAALKEAARMANATGWWLDVVACWNAPTSLVVPYALGSVELEEGTRQLLQDTVTSTFGMPLPANMSTTLVHGQPRQKLIEMSAGSDMLVVGRRGYGGFAGLLLGSVSQACVAHAHCPVLVVNTGKEADGPAHDQ